MDKDLWFIAGLMVGMILIGAILGSLGWKSNSDVEELGSAICDQKYNASYVSYIEDILRCEPNLEHYDGVKVVIGPEVQDG